MGNVEVGRGGQNTLVLIDKGTGRVVLGGWLEGGELAKKIRDATGECNRCRVKKYLCSGLKWVSGTGVFHQSQNVTVGANGCPMMGKVYEIDLTN